ncbi:MAG: hypothetical protein A2506_11695 [Elusimicrobia bacterium RIFOXYD12_FULL_66_9]|nr:MAG: hypothetical protein A2506_11695 [Elusimicrobia bacterium RIFOXYD12_FULL_66_9]
MKHRKTPMLPIILMVAVSSAAAEPAKLSFSGQIRARGEATNVESFTSPARKHGVDQALLRVRLAADADAGHDIKAYLQIQDSRVFGSEASVAANTANLDLHQGYLDVLKLGGLPLDLRAGRMELSYGDQRLVSPLDWSNVGRAWDGVRLRYTQENATLDAFLTNVKQTANTRRNQHFWGLYAASKPFPRHEADLYLMGRDFGDGTQTSELGTTGNLSDRTLGARFKGTPGAWDYTGEAAWQFGRKAGQSVRAWAMAATGGYTFEGSLKPHAGVEYDYASGDADPRDKKVRTFDPLFPFGHALQGFQDVFSWKNGHAFKCSASIDPVPDWKLQGDYHHFMLEHSFDAWYDATGAVIARDATGASGRNIGDEIDIHVRGKFRDTIGLWFGYSRFFAGRFVKNAANGMDRDWAFFQAALNF